MLRKSNNVTIRVGVMRWKKYSHHFWRRQWANCPSQIIWVYIIQVARREMRGAWATRGVSTLLKVHNIRNQSVTYPIYKCITVYNQPSHYYTYMRSV